MQRGHWIYVSGKNEGYADIKCLKYGSDANPRRIWGQWSDRFVHCPVCGRLIGIPKGRLKWLRESGEVR
jgi:hypothetical protein